MAVIIHDLLAKRLANKQLYVANDVCIGACVAYKLSSSAMKIQMEPGYRGIISGLNVLPCQAGEVFSFTGSTFESSPEGPCPGFAGPISVVDAVNHSFNVEFDMGIWGTWNAITGAFSFHSPVVLGIFGMFSYSHVEIYTGDVPAATDDLDILTPACSLIPISVQGVFDQNNLGTYARMIYDEENNAMHSSTALYGTAQESGTPTWVRVSAYCRERASHSSIDVKKYSIIIPVQGNSGIVIESPEMYANDSVTLHELKVLF